MADEETQLGKYTLKRKLATGGMAEIWLSEQRGPGGFAKELVIKRILPHLADDAKFVEMFLDEARLAAQLHHPNIVQIFDLGEADGSYYIAMEYIRGYDIEQFVRQAEQSGTFVDPYIAARIIADACGALDYAHTFTDPDGNRLNLVHRDISPQNILIDVQGAVKLVDFGVAKAASSTHKTQTGAVKGKFAYMSPEQIKGKDLDGRSDLFAMGIVLFELLTGVRPFGHESEMMAVAAILDQAAPKPSSVRKKTPKGLDAIVLKALEKAPDDRFPTAEAMQMSLETFLKSSGQPIGNKELKDYIVGLFGEQLSTRPIPTRTSMPPQGGAARQDAGAPPPPPSDLYGNETKRWQSDPKWAPTERVDTSSSSGGVGAGLVIALIAVFLAIAGGGYGLYVYLTSEAFDGPVARADAGDRDDAGAVTSSDDMGATVPEEDAGMAAQSPDAGALPVTDAGAVSAAEVGLSQTDAAAVAVADLGQTGADDTGMQATPDAVELDTGQQVAQLVPDGGLVPQLPVTPDVGIDLPSGLQPDAEPTPLVDGGTAQAEEPVKEDAGAAPVVDAGGVAATEDVAAQMPDAMAVGDDAGQVFAATDDDVEEDPAPAAAGEDAADDAEQVAAQEDVEEDTGQAPTEEDVEEEPTQVASSDEEEEEEEEDDDRPGTLRIRVTSRGRYEVLIDDRVVGRVPPAIPPQRLAPGRYTVEVRRIGESDGTTERVTIEPGETETVRISVD